MCALLFSEVVNDDQDKDAPWDHTLDFMQYILSACVALSSVEIGQGHDADVGCAMIFAQNSQCV